MTDTSSTCRIRQTGRPADRQTGSSDIGGRDHSFQLLKMFSSRWVLAGRCCFAVAASLFQMGHGALAAQVACPTPSPGFTNCVRVTNSGADQAFTVPGGVTSISIKAWGAGGGGANPAFYTAQKGGGGGGFSTGTVAVTAGQQLRVVVGSGGLVNSTLPTYGGGGAGGDSTAQPIITIGASGGGYSGVFSTLVGAQANALVIAGGGGGSSPGADNSAPPGGGGGGLVGGNGGSTLIGGQGGTQSAGGAASTQVDPACPLLSTPGGPLQGGSGAGRGEGGGGGGGGWFGGGGGACQGGSGFDNGMGGGGSGYIAGAGVTAASTAAGSNAPSNCVGGAASTTSDPNYVPGIGTGGGCGATGTAAGAGLVVIQWIAPTVTIAKTTAAGSAGTNTFNFTHPALTDAFGTVTGSSTIAVTGATTATGPKRVGTILAAQTIQETPPPGFITTSIVCNDANAATDGNTNPVAVTGIGINSITLPAAVMKGGSSTANQAADITCTFNNQPATVALRKISVGGVGNFSFTRTNLAAAPASITTATPGVAAPATPTPIMVTTVGTAVTLTETPAAGFVLTAASCTDASSAVTGNPPTFGTFAGNVVTVPAANVRAGSTITCTVTNTLPHTLQLRKTWSAGALAGDAISAATTGGSANASIASVATAAGNTTTGVAVNVTLGNTITLPVETFTSGAAVNYTTTATCNNSVAPLANASLPASFTVAAADTAVVCTYANTVKTASFTLRKTWTNAKINDVVNVSATGPTALTPLTSVANTANETDAGAAQIVSAGSSFTLAETLTTGTAIDYASALACTGNATALAGNVLTVNAADTAIVCTFTNARRLANLSIVKTANPTNVQTGGTVTFTLTVNNAGPAAANGSILRDKPGVGLSCTAAPTCVASGGAACPSAAALTAAALTSNAGVPIPVLPAGGQAVVTLVCTATASGQ